MSRLQTPTLREPTIRVRAIMIANTEGDASERIPEEHRIKIVAMKLSLYVARYRQRT